MITLSADIPVQAREWRNEPKIRRWCRQDGLISHRQQVAWMDRIHHDPTISMMGVEGKEGAVGVAGLTSIDHKNSKAEFSLYIAPEHQGHGYGEKALRALLAHGFNDLGLGRIWGEVFDGNPAYKMFEKIGFEHEGTLRQTYWKGGKYIDSHIISIIREEFNGVD